MLKGDISQRIEYCAERAGPVCPAECIISRSVFLARRKTSAIRRALQIMHSVSCRLPAYRPEWHTQRYSTKPGVQMLTAQVADVSGSAVRLHLREIVEI